MEQHTYTVAELSAVVAATLQATFVDEVWVQGEIRDLSRARTGHVYFSLVDPGTDGNESVLPVTLFATERFVVNRVLMRSGGAIRMTDGINVRIRGRLSLYPQRSTVQLRMSWIDTDFTLGQLAAERHALIEKLTADGTLLRNRDLAMPAMPLRVGLVTSSGSAAHADFVTELQRSGYGFRVLVSHAAVQGIDAPASLAAALDRLAAVRLDVVAVVRGGGAQTDLATFDTEIVARAISRCAVPVLTGIGHETDQTVADLAAHAAHKTPTASAQAIVAAVRAFVGRLDAAAIRIQRAHRRVVERSGAVVEHLAFRLRSAGDVHLGRNQMRLESIWSRIGAGAVRRCVTADGRIIGIGEQSMWMAKRGLGVAESQVDHLSTATGAAGRRALAHAAHRLDVAAALTESHDPAVMFARGWSITYGPGGTPVREPGEVDVGDRLHTVVGGGAIPSVVVEAEGGP